MKHRHARTVLAALALIALSTLTGCSGSTSADGSGGTDGGNDQEPSYKVIELVSDSGAGETAATVLTWLETPAAVTEYAAQFPPPLQAKVAKAFAAATVPEGEFLFGAIVSVGCSAPTSAVVFDSMSGLEIQASPMPDPNVDCDKSTTTVAVVTGPAPN